MPEVKDGTAMRLYNGATAIAKAVTCEIQFDVDFRETVHKDNVSSWAEGKPSRKSGSASCNFLYAEAEGFEDFFDAIEADTLLTMKYSDENSGDTRYSLDCYVTSLGSSATVNEDVVANVSFRLVGQPTKETIS